MTPARPPSPEELSAYADGELRGRHRRRVARHLAEEPASVALVTAYRRQDELLRLGLKGLAGVPEGARAAGADRSGPGRRAFIATAAAVAVAAGTTGWWLTRGRDARQAADDLAQRAILAHLSHAGATGAPISRAAAAAQMRQVIGDTFAVPDLSRFGLHLVGVHEPAIGQRPGILLRYAGAGGAVSCYFAPVPADGETTFASAGAAGVTAVYRVDEGVGYAVVGDRPAGELRRIASDGLRYASGAPEGNGGTSDRW